MPTNFGPEITSAPEVENHVTVKEGVSDPAHSYADVGAVFDAAAKIFTARKDNKDNGVVNAFLQEQLKIADALEQGSISQTAARTRQRATFSQYVTNHGHLTDDLLKVQATITGTAGLSRVVAQGTERTNRIEAQDKAAVEAGLAAADASDEELAVARENLQLAAAAKSKHDERMRTLDLKSKGLAVESAEYQKIERERTEATKEYIGDTMPARYNQVTTAYESILKSDKSGAEKVKELEILSQQMMAEYSKELSVIDSGDRAVFVKPFEELTDLYKKLASGEIEAAELKNGIDITKRKAEATFLMDPEIRNTVAVSSLLGPEAATKLILEGHAPNVIAKVGKFIAGGDPSNQIAAPSLYTEDKGDKKAVDIYTKSITAGIMSNDKAYREESEAHLNTVLEGLIDDEGRIRRNPKAAFQSVKWFASTEFQQAVANRPELFEPYQDDIKTVMEAHYFDEVATMISREFENKKVVVSKDGSFFFGEEVTVDSIVAAVPTPTGMKFEPMDDSPQARTAAQSLNRELKPIINESLRAMAHLDGRSDYGTYYSEVADKFGGVLPSGLKETGGGGDDVLKGNDAGDDLTLDDFKMPKVSGGRMPEEVANDTEFMSELDRLATKYEIEPSILAAVMDFETGGTFNPAEKNKAGSSGTGLIQFMANTAKGLGTTTAELAKMSRVEQMAYVEKYFDQWASKIKGGNASDVYMAVLFPKAIDKPDSYVLFRQGTTAYKQNKGLDTNGDGTVTKAEAARSVVDLVGKYESS